MTILQEMMAEQVAWAMRLYAQGRLNQEMFTNVVEDLCMTRHWWPGELPDPSRWRPVLAQEVEAAMPLVRERRLTLARLEQVVESVVQAAQDKEMAV